MASPVDGLTKVGEAKLKVLFWDVYYSTLYNQTGTYQGGNPPIALKLEYLRDIDAKDLIDSTQEEWEKLGVKKAQFATWLTALESIFPDIKKGDTIVLLVNQKSQSEFFHNDSSIGNVTDPSFGPSFLRIWLDEKSSYPKVRKKLIGQNK